MSTSEALNKAPGVSQTAAPFNPKTASDTEKLEAGWSWIDIPEKDPYDYVFKGIYLNNLFFPPGKHLVEPDVAASINERLVAFSKYNTRLMRPTADLTSLSQVPGAR
jgi:hypothetical protein